MGYSLVPILKKEGNVRICGDYSVILNSNLVVNNHPLPTIDEFLLRWLAGQPF